MKKNIHKGFTVLELLVVLGILTILVAMVLTGLNSARRQSDDERKVANLRTVALGLQEYFNACRQYPVNIDPSTLDSTTAACSDIPGNKIGDIVTGAKDLKFNQSGSPYFYVALTSTVGSNQCTNYHMWTTLTGNTSGLLSQRSGKSEPYTIVVASPTSPVNLSVCTGSTSGLSSLTSQMFDIFK